MRRDGVPELGVAELGVPERGVPEGPGSLAGGPGGADGPSLARGVSLC